MVTSTKGKEKTMDVIRHKGLADVIPNYAGGNSGCYINGGANQVCFGFYVVCEGSDEPQGFWFKRKKDAVHAAKWVSDTGWSGAGDLEGYLQEALAAAWFKDRKGEYPELGKVYF
jgi:hypothetical protein